MRKKLFLVVVFLSIFFNVISQNQQKNYTQTISGSELSIDMIAIPGGEFVMGSISTEDEKPEHTVKINPFWMA